MAEIKDELELIKKQLSKHRGKGNEISAGIIGDLLKFEKDDTHAKARYRIKNVLKSITSHWLQTIMATLL